MKNDGYMADSLSYYLNTSYVVEKENLASGKFLVLLSSGVPDDEFMKDNFSIKRIQPYQRPMIYASVGISRNTGNGFPWALIWRWKIREYIIVW